MRRENDCRCRDCKHWSPVHPEDRRGRCKRFPPIYVPPNGYNHERVGVWHHPPTDDNDGCGEFAKAE